MDNHDLAICISTYNRPESFERCIDSFLKHTPVEIPVFVVDDCSPDLYCNADFRFSERSGISKVKNKSLQLCYESGKNNFILLDDDTLALQDGWYLPYLNSGENHLCATFLKPKRSHSGLNQYHLGNGYCLYFTKRCIDVVGGFDTNYTNKYEHCDISRRIFNNCLTRNTYQDVIGGNELVYCLDQDNAIQRSFTDREMQDNLKSGYGYFRSQSASRKYIEFRT